MLLTPKTKVKMKNLKVTMATLMMCCMAITGYSQEKFTQQTGLYIGFDRINVARLHPVTDEILETWGTENYATYSTDARINNFTFAEYSGETKKLVKTYTHKIISHTQDSDVYTLDIKANDGGVYRVLLWKDGSMLVIQSASDVYLVTGEYELIKF